MQSVQTYLLILLVRVKDLVFMFTPLTGHFVSARFRLILAAAFLNMAMGNPIFDFYEYLERGMILQTFWLC